MDKRTITVQGRATVLAEPDVIVLSFNISANN